MATDDLDEFTSSVLYLACTEGPYMSSVLMDIDMVDRGRVRQTALLLIEDALWTLNEAGYVVFRVPTDAMGRAKSRSSPLTAIRVTEAGHAKAGMLPPVRVVGPRHSMGGRHPDYPGDMTDWRNHSRTALGYQIERMSLRDHITVYWDHAELHFDSLWEIEDAKKERDADR